TLFGNFYAVRQMRFEDAIKNTIAEGKKIMIEELNHFLEDKRGKELYTRILNVLKKEIKTGVEIKLGREVDDKKFTSALESLVNYNFVEK
ncbi:MAG: ATP-binding protein, partial [Saccharolobus sp.]